MQLERCQQLCNSGGENGVAHFGFTANVPDGQKQDQIGTPSSLADGCHEVQEEDETRYQCVLQGVNRVRTVQPERCVELCRMGTVCMRGKPLNGRWTYMAWKYTDGVYADTPRFGVGEGASKRIEDNCGLCQASSGGMATDDVKCCGAMTSVDMYGKTCQEAQNKIDNPAYMAPGTPLTIDPNA